MRIKILQDNGYKKIIGTKYFILLGEMSFELLYGDIKYLIIIPKGFVTDFASIPIIFFNFDKTRYISYIMHDYLYSFIGKIILKEEDSILLGELGELVYDQRLADEILIAGLNTEGMNITGQQMVSLGLDIGGRFNFKKKNKKISKIKKEIEFKKANNIIY